jgi:hypothetical protein
MALICLKAPLVEPIELNQAKLYLKIEQDVEDRLLEGMIKSARQAIEAFTARSLLRQEWRFTLNAGYAAAQSDLNYLSHFHNRGLKGIDLPRTPFLELLSEPKIVDDYGTRPVRNYRLDHAGRLAKIHFGSEVAEVFNGQGSLQIDFAAGYGSNPSDVPEPIKQALLMIVTQLYDNRSGANDNTGLSVPMNETVVRMLKPYQLLRLF